MSTGGWIFLLVVAGLIIAAVAGYNKLVGLRQRSEEAWSDIDVQLKRRTDLIPNLVETVKGYAAHERGALDAVVRARGAAMTAQTPDTRAQAENALTSALRQLFALAVISPSAEARGFVIDSFVVSLQVDPDASLVVREDITFDFRGAHQGVFRTIPIRYDRGGYEFALRLEGIGVYDVGGAPLRHETTYPGRSVKIKAWVPGASDTKKTVTVVYRVRRGILTFEDHDELYWSATGNEWEVPIRLAEVFVKVPPGVADGAVRAVAYSGPRGSGGQDYTLDRVERFWRFSTMRGLRPREGLTVVVGWPPGRVGRPPAIRQALWSAGATWR